MDNSSRGGFEVQFKNEIILEPYLLRLKRAHRIYICKLRTCNIKFPKETGRWRNKLRDKRKCHICMNDIGDEFHYYMLL